MASTGGGAGDRTEAGPTGPGVLAPSSARAWLGSVGARRVARAFMALGLAGVAAAFIVRAGAEVRVGMLLAGVAAVEFGGLLAVRSRGPIAGLGRTAPRHAFVIAGLIAAGYIGATLAGNPAVGAATGHLSSLKLVALLAALVGGLFDRPSSGES